jgi:hypothetical protein
MCSHGRWNVTSLRRSLVSSEGDALHDRRDHASPRGHSRGDFGRDLLLRRRALGCKAVVQIILSGLSFHSLVAGVVGAVEPDADIDPAMPAPPTAKMSMNQRSAARPRVSGFEE